MATMSPYVTNAEKLGIDPNAARAPIVDVASLIGNNTINKPSAGDILRANYEQTGAYAGGGLAAGGKPLFVQMMEAGYTQDDIAKALLANDKSLSQTENGMMKSPAFGDPYQRALEIVGGQLNKWNAGADVREQKAMLGQNVNTAQTAWKTAQRQGNDGNTWQAGQDYWAARNAQREYDNSQSKLGQMMQQRNNAQKSMFQRPQATQQPTQPTQQPSGMTMNQQISALQQPQGLRPSGLFSATNMPKRW